MLKNSLGGYSKLEEAIFPLVTFSPNLKLWKCVGTGFFIQPMGGFVTAKHVFQDADGKTLPTLYGVQTTVNNELHIRPVSQIVPHPTSDIVIGMLGRSRYGNGDHARKQSSVYFTIDVRGLTIGDEITTYAYPLSMKEETDDGLTGFTFQGKWSSGKVVDYHPNGASLLKGPCYQTSMFFDHGASGGPVIRNSLVVGVNSTAMTIHPDEEPVSFITPMSEVLSLSVRHNGKIISVKDLIREGYLEVKV